MRHRELTPGETAERAGVAVSALHFYEREGLISSRRTAGNQRRYHRDVLRRVAFIRVSQSLGISLAQIDDGALDAARGPDAEQGRLGTALGTLAPGARCPDPAAPGTARPAGRLHRLRLPVAQELLALQRRRRPELQRAGSAPAATVGQPRSRASRSSSVSRRTITRASPSRTATTAARGTWL